MTAVQPPGFMQALTNHSALTMRRNTMLLMDGATYTATIPRGGAHPSYGGGLAVTGSGASMQVTVASGMAAIPHSQAFGGLYSIYNDGNVNLSVDAADATQYRRDVVIAEILDTADGDGSNLWQLRVVKGTLAASPPAPLPALPAKSISLGVVAVNPGVTNLSGLVFESRTFIPTLGGTLISGSDSDKVNPARAGMLNTQSDNNVRVTYWDGSAWRFVADNGWSSYTPSITGWGAVTFSTKTGRYKWLGEKVVAVCILMITSHAGSGASNINVGLPVTPARSQRQNLLLVTENTGGGTPGMGAAVILQSGSGAWTDRFRLLDTNGHIINQTGADVPTTYEYYIQGTYEVA